MLLTLVLFVQVNPLAWGVNHTEFIIHGLWPQFVNGSWPQYCCHHSACRYNESAIAALVPELTEWWTDFHNPHRLWKHEWQRHGSCSEWDEYNYFHNGLTWRKELPMKKMLTRAGLQPRVLYKKAIFIARLAHLLQVGPAITCKGLLLEQVELCYWNGVLGNCSRDVKNNCSAKLYY